MSQFPDQAMGAPPPPKPSPMKWIILLVGVLLGVPLLCCGGCMVVAYLGIGQVGAQVKADVAATPEAVEAIGTVESTSMSITEAAAAQQRMPGKTQIMAYEVKGTKGSGVVIVDTEGGNHNRSSVLRMPDGTEIPLNRAP